jgi:Meiotically up-regulated gene 113
MSNKKGFTYLVHAENLYRFKIGCAINYERRLKELQTSSPVKLHLIAKKKSYDMYAEERKWHSLFKTKRKNGEWFELDYKEVVKITRCWKADIGIDWRDRTVDKLIEGNNYFVSFNGKKVIEVVLEKICDIPTRKVIVNSIDGKNSWILFDDEVRETEIAAIFNHVTF